MLLKVKAGKISMLLKVKVLSSEKYLLSLSCPNVKAGFNCCALSPNLPATQTVRIVEVQIIPNPEPGTPCCRVRT